jgi:catechol 2,3-dioxygenase-like lactoylglutathione lyase family enzyme
MSLPAAARPVAFLLTRDRALTLPFYRDVLGLTLVSEDAYAVAFDARGLDVRLTTVGDHVASPHPVICWEVPDILAASRDLSAKGVRFTAYPGLTEGDYAIWADPDGRVKLNWFPDPEGNMLGLIERG